ncbi:addiction module protein [Variovorax robiniae]|uniref:Addiction module protein n=1 Tax=Variovorax robiniae TaxID=1836199 RepID=A0ABU8X6H6_9BURK
MQIAELAALPLPERLAAMEALWDSLSHDPAHDPSPAWHQEVLAQRRKELAQGHTLPWDEVKRHLRALRDDKPH